MKVVFLPEVVDFFEELAWILYEKGYFGDYEWSSKYVEDLNIDIKNNLPIKRHRPAPPYYEKYGKDLYYAVFKKNRRTSYYTFFSKYDDYGQTVFLVCYIGNNHTEAQRL